MAKIEKIGNIQVIDNKKDKVFDNSILSFFFCLNFPHIFPTRAKNIAVSHYFFWLNVVNKLPLKRNKAY